MSDMPEKDDDQVLAGEYALGLMSATEAKAFEARMASDPALRAAYVQWAEDFVRLAEDIPEEAPPGRVKTRLDKALFAEAPKPKMSTAERFGLRNLYSLLFLVAVAMVWFIVELPPRAALPPEAPVYAATIEAEDGTLVVLASYDDGRDQLYVERQAGRAGPNRDLELWLIAGDAPPVSLGVLSRDEDRERIEISTEQEAALQGGVLAISDEPRGGSPTGAPTGEVLAIGPLTNV